MRAPHPPDSPRALIGDKWTLLIVRDLASGPRRFVELERVLPGISTEQLRSRLITMVAQGLLTRRRYREVPPRVDYSLTPRSRDLLPVIAALARWTATGSGRLRPRRVDDDRGAHGLTPRRRRWQAGAAAGRMETPSPSARKAPGSGRAGCAAELVRLGWPPA